MRHTKEGQTNRVTIQKIATKQAKEEYSSKKNNTPKINNTPQNPYNTDTSTPKHGTKRGKLSNETIYGISSPFIKKDKVCPKIPIFENF
jgi:hypothetical protein